MGSSTRETSSRTGGAHCWLAFGRFGQFLMLKKYALRSTLVSLLMRPCLLEAEQERIRKETCCIQEFSAACFCTTEHFDRAEQI